MSPRDERPRCGTRMKKAGVPCGRADGHGGNCMTPEAVRKAYDRQIAYAAAERARRQAEIDAVKLAKGCEDCGYRADAKALDFDHLDPRLKSGGISEMMMHSWDKVLAELAKCRVLCANCHRVRTHRRPAPETGDGPSAQIRTDHLPGRRESQSPQPPPR